MDTVASKPWLDQFGEFIANHLGLDFSGMRRRDLERGLAAAAREFGFDDMRACVDWLTATAPSQSQIEVLAHHLTVAETYFLREPRVFEALERQILPELIASRQGSDRRLRFWSAGCATGEEPYSLAFILSRVLPDWQGWNITILGTDISSQALRKATEGVYGEWSFRGTPPWVKEHCFRQRRDGRYEVLPRFKNAVTFAFHNLAEETYPSVYNNTNAMDVILCSNVLMYFTPEARAQAGERFFRSLVDGGYLAVSSAEATPAQFPRFEPVRPAGTLMFRRSRAVVTALEPAIWAPPAPIVPAPPAPAPPLPKAPRPQPPARPTPKAAPAPRRELYDEALALYERGHYPAVIETLRSLHESRAYALLARAHAGQGELDEALESCERAITAEKVNPVYHYLQASILTELDRREKAVDALKRALYLDPGFAVAHVALANLLQQMGKTEEAGRHFRNALAALKDYPRDAPVPNAEGLTAGRLREAVQAMWQEAKP